MFWGDVKVDLFYQQMEDDAEQQHPMLHNLQIEVFPLRRIPFCNLMLPAPQTSVECMERQYGANWSTQVMVWNHLFNSENMPNHDKCRVTLKLEEYNALVAKAGFAQPLAQTSVSKSKQAKKKKLSTSNLQNPPRLYLTRDELTMISRWLESLSV